MDRRGFRKTRIAEVATDAITEHTGEYGYHQGLDRSVVSGRLTPPVLREVILTVVDTSVIISTKRSQTLDWTNG